MAAGNLGDAIDTPRRDEGVLGGTATHRKQQPLPFPRRKAFKYSVRDPNSEATVARLAMNDARRIFISYSHDSVEHRGEVKALADRLRHDGITVVLDSDCFPGGPAEGWPAWSERQVRECDVVLVICTKIYARRYDNDEEPGIGLGTVCEARAIRQSLYNSGGKNESFRVVLLRSEYHQFIPDQLKAYHLFRAYDAESYEHLVQWLRGEASEALAPPESESTLTWPEPIADHEWQLADRGPERGLVDEVLCGGSSRRLLLIEGASGVGKTALVQEILGYAEHLELDFALVDFKGSPTLGEILDGVLLDVGSAGLPNTAAATGIERQSRFLLDLQQLTTPLLLVLDTYEKASDEAAQWIENQFLRRLPQMPGVLVIIAGQKIPRADHQRWSVLAASRALSPIDEPDHWLDYSRRVLDCSSLKREHVESLTLAVGGDPAQVAALLGSLVRAFTPVPEAKL